MHKFQILAVTLCLAAGSSAFADVVAQVDANTGSISGMLGSVDFQFNGGALSYQPATVLISDFTTDGTFGGTLQDFGDVTGGPIPGPITISNTDADNEHFETFRFGNSLEFDLTFSGPTVTAPNGTSLSTSVFTFSMFSNTAGTIPVLTPNPSGAAATVTVNLNGTLTALAISPNVAVPEPAYTWLAGGGLLLLGVLRLRGRGERTVPELPTLPRDPVQ
jgi:hypothetical protein